MRLKLVLIAFISLNLILCASTQKKIEKAQKKSSQYQYNMGSFHLNNGNLDEAIRYFNKAISLNPNYFLAFNGLGLACLMKGNHKESIKYFQKCLAINPSFSEARNNLGTIYQEMGILDKAEHEFRTAAMNENYSSRHLSYYNLARLRFYQEEFREALNYVNKSLAIYSSSAMSHNLKGLIFERLNNLDEAIKSYDKALKILPEDINLSFNLAVAYFKNSEFSRAKEIFEKLSLKATDPEMKDKIDQYLKMINKNLTPLLF